MDLEENAVTPPMRLISGGGGKDGPLRVFVLRESACALVYGWDAVWIADTFFSERKVLKSVECGNSSDSMDVDVEGIQLINVNHAKLLPVLRCALGESKRQVEIYSRGIDCWSLTKKLFPGNEDSIEEILSQTNLLADSMLTLAINFHSNNFVTAAFIDTNSKKISILQYSDNDQLSDTESLIVSIDPKECILRSGSETDSTVLKLQSVLQMCSIPFTFTSKVSWKAQDVEQDLKRLLTKDLDQSLLDILELKGCLECVSAVIKHLELLSHDDNFGGFSLEKFTLSSYMKLDFAAIKALNLFPSSSDSSVQSSLFGLLNHCQTAMGSRSLMRRLKQPILDKNVIEKRLDLLECFYLDSELRQSLHEQHLKRIPDLDRLLKKLSSRKASLKDVVHLYTFVIRLPILIEALETFSNEALLNLIHETFISPLKACQQDLSAFESLIEQTVDLQATMKHEYIIRADFCPELAALSRAKEKISNIIDAIRVKVASELNLEESKLKLNHNGTHGYFLRVTRKDETALRGRPKFICLETRKDGVKFTTKEIRQHSSELNDYSKEYNLLQTAVVDKIIDVTQTYSPVFENLKIILSELDVNVGLAVACISASHPYVRPKILEMGSDFIHLEKARHPCMEFQDYSTFIPNDLFMDSNSKFQLITGPNMGGKSTYIRQTGVILLMAQVGCFVPCESATISIVDSILARVGAGDCQSKGVSTFMAEMLEASSIINSSTRNSFLIIDELGRGTSTYDGFGLAYAIAEHLSSVVNAYGLFATHFHELTALSHSVPCVVNKHVSAITDEGSITMLYQVDDGSCDQSFGIHVAKLADFPSDVIELAKRKVAELEGFNGISLKKSKTSHEALNSAAQMSEKMELIHYLSQLDTESKDIGQLREDLRNLHKRFSAMFAP